MCGMAYVCILYVHMYYSLIHISCLEDCHTKFDSPPKNFHFRSCVYTNTHECVCLCDAKILQEPSGVNLSVIFVHIYVRRSVEQKMVLIY